MFEKISNFTKWKKWILIAFVVLSFALVNSFNVISTHSVYGWVLSLLLIIGIGVFYWLIFEVLIGFLYSGLKPSIEKKISLNQFNNVFRIGIIFLNILIFAIYKIIIAINFYTNILLLVAGLVFYFIYLCITWILIKKKLLKELWTKKIELTYFSFVFMYLFLHTIMWGVL